MLFLEGIRAIIEWLVKWHFPLEGVKFSIGIEGEEPESNLRFLLKRFNTFFRW